MAATAREIAPTLELLRSKPLIPAAKNIDVLISGIGLTASTYHISRQLQIRKYDLAIQAGVAGCFDLSRKLGSVVVVQKETIADQSVVELENLQSTFDLKQVPANQFPFNKGWLKNNNKELLKSTGLKAVTGISVNQITTSKKTISFFRERFGPVTESMEGAAFHFVCLMEEIPFLQIRSISNYIGERNRKKWDMNNSVNHLNTEIIRILNRL